jgi:hypothetical protein
MVASTPTPPRFTLLPDEKWGLEARIVTLENKNQELWVKLAELEGAQKSKTKKEEEEGEQGSSATICELAEDVSSCCCR